MNKYKNNLFHFEYSLDSSFELFEELNHDLEQEMRFKNDENKILIITSKNMVKNKSIEDYIKSFFVTLSFLSSHF